MFQMFKNSNHDNNKDFNTLDYILPQVPFLLSMSLVKFFIIFLKFKICNRNFITDHPDPDLHMLKAEIRFI